MRTDVFIQWLEDRGAAFDSPREQRGQGHACAHVRLRERQSVLDLTAGCDEVPHDLIKQVVRDLGLNPRDLPSGVSSFSDSLRA